MYRSRFEFLKEILDVLQGVRYKTFVVWLVGLVVRCAAFIVLTDHFMQELIWKQYDAFIMIFNA